MITFALIPLLTEKVYRGSEMVLHVDRQGSQAVHEADGGGVHACGSR